MEQYIKKSVLLAEIEKGKRMCDNHHSDYWNGCYNTFIDILSFIDTLEVKEAQEESVSIWHDASEEPKPNMELICIGQYGNPLVLSSNSNSFKSRYISKWAYFNDLLNLSNVQRTVKDWKEEPVSEKLEKLKKLADAMYYAAQQLTTDASRLHKAMDEYHKFIIHECKEEPKKCMYSKDNYTDEDRKVLCDGCEEECRFNKKEDSVNNGLDLGCGVIWRDKVPASEEWIEELRTKLDSLSKEDFEKVFDKYAIVFNEEPVSEDLGEAAENYATTDEVLPNGKVMINFQAEKAFRAGANWQKEQLLAKAVDGEVTYGKSLAIPSLGYRLDKERLDFGDKVKVIVIKEG